MAPPPPPPPPPYLDDGWAPRGFVRAPWEDLGWLRRFADAGSDPKADFDRYLITPPADTPTTVPIYGWMHVAILGAWEKIARELFSQVERSGLRAATSKVFVGVVGPDADLSWFPPWVEVVKRDGPLEAGENSTLQALWDWSKTAPPSKVWYIHTKGASRAAAPPIEAWRDYLSYFNLLRWREQSAALDTGDYDCCGVDYQATADPNHAGKRGFAGNFFWARTEYLAGMPADGVKLDGDRWCAEWSFVGAGAPRVKAFHDSRFNFYAGVYPRGRYEV